MNLDIYSQEKVCILKKKISPVIFQPYKKLYRRAFQQNLIHSHHHRKNKTTLSEFIESGLYSRSKIFFIITYKVVELHDRIFCA